MANVIRNIRGGSAKWNEEDRLQLATLLIKAGYTVKIEYHPAKSEYVNNVQYCLHIWKPVEKFAGKLPIPPSLFVGIKGIEV